MKLDVSSAPLSTIQPSRNDVPSSRAPRAAGPGQPPARGLNTVDRGRHSVRFLNGGPRPDAPVGFERARAERSPQTLKSIAALPDAPAAVGDGRTVAPPKRASVDAAVDLPTSVPAALYLHDLTLNRSFNLFSRTNQLYVSAIAWDLSGRPPQVYPPVAVSGATPAPATFALKPNETITFIGEGIQLWPQRPVKGGLSVMLVVMESDSDLRQLGKKIAKVREAIDGSDLASVLATLGGVATGGQLLAVERAARALSGVVETILQENHDDLVASFQGTYGAEGIAEPRSETYDRRGASITLNLRPDESRPPRAGQE